MTAAKLEALAARAEAATGPDRELDAAIWCALNPPAKMIRVGKEWRIRDGRRDYAADSCTEFTGSLDAAMSLVPVGWGWMAGNRNPPHARAYVNNGQPHFKGIAAAKNPDLIWAEVTAATPALALTAAALRALASKEAGQ